MEKNTYQEEKMGWEAVYQMEKIEDNEFYRKRIGNNGGKRRGRDRRRRRGESTRV